METITKNADGMPVWSLCNMLADLRRAKQALDFKKNSELKKDKKYRVELNISFGLQNKNKEGKERESIVKLPKNTFAGLRGKFGVFIVEWTVSTLEVCTLLEDQELIELYSEVLGFSPCEEYYNGTLGMHIFK